jgi:trehalose-phosphatase
MRDIREDWDLISLRISAAPRVCLLSDFDGTLVELGDRPERITLAPAARKLLHAFGRCDRAVAGVVSGRAIDDLVARVDVEGLWYAGNHGFEIREPGGTTTRFYDRADVELLDRVRDELRAETATVPGVLLEHKGPIVAVHYRQVALPQIADVERAFCRVMERYRPQLMLAHGNHVFEARLRGTRNKGTAIRLIRKQLPAGSLVVYFGDDLTDRDAFRELRASGISVEVGGTDSALAHYTLPDPSSVHEVLRRFLEALGSTSGKAGRSRKA